MAENYLERQYQAADFSGATVRTLASAALRHAWKLFPRHCVPIDRLENHSTADPALSAACVVLHLLMGLPKAEVGRRLGVALTGQESEAEFARLLRQAAMLTVCGYPRIFWHERSPMGLKLEIATPRTGAWWTRGKHSHPSEFEDACAWNIITPDDLAEAGMLEDGARLLQLIIDNNWSYPDSGPAGVGGYTADGLKILKGYSSPRDRIRVVVVSARAHAKRFAAGRTELEPLLAAFALGAYSELREQVHGLRALHAAEATILDGALFVAPDARGIHIATCDGPGLLVTFLELDVWGCTRQVANFAKFAAGGQGKFHKCWLPSGEAADWAALLVQLEERLAVEA